MARAPGELVRALAVDVRRTAIVLPDLRDFRLAEMVLDLRRLSHVRLIVEAPTGSPAHLMLAGDGTAEPNLDLEQWTDQRRREEWLPGRTDGQQHPAAEPERASATTFRCTC
ncbi:hypothetical protein NLX86_30650 [Streptomyces sp. A3M-1-3]|uniref:hypothetical protein n=1 Tax=Streptomyces sp. A3M-1-3 TaxID=2962044 RepID=UPI0020B6E7DC|nr:hypothetical protein [Streptomyces sp. A3M-1-3]MCP3822286.1 hypothetical protein [Streptomyces sp. A3M-1-3]